MEYNTGIYQIVNLVNGKRYIGSAVNLERRENDHFKNLRKNNHFNKKLQRAYNKYGNGNISFETLLYCSKENLIFYEQQIIDLYNFKKELYNIAPVAGSQLGLIHSKESKNKMRESHLGKTRVMSEDHKNKIRIAMKLNGHKPPSQKGTKRSSVTCEKLRISHLNPSKEIRKKLSDSHKGKKRSKESIKKMIETRKSSGYIISEETKKKIGSKHKGKKITKKQIKKFRQTTRTLFSKIQIRGMNQMKSNGFSIREIAKYFNCSPPTIKQYIKN